MFFFWSMLIKNFKKNHLTQHCSYHCLAQSLKIVAENVCISCIEWFLDFAFYSEFSVE